MFKLKVNGNYNILINDIGVHASHVLSPIITQEQYDTSNSLKGLIADGIITIEPVESIPVVVVEKEELKSSSSIIEYDGMFVRDGNTYTNPENVFVAHEKVIKTEDVEISDVEDLDIEQENTSPIEDPISEVIEKIEEIQEVQETKEIKEVKVEDTKVSTTPKVRVSKIQKNKNL